MADLRAARLRGRENRAGQGRRVQPMPARMGKPEDKVPAKVCSVIRGWAVWGSVIFLGAHSLLVLFLLGSAGAVGLSARVADVVAGSLATVRSAGARSGF